MQRATHHFAEEYILSCNGIPRDFHRRFWPGSSRQGSLLQQLFQWVCGEDHATWSKRKAFPHRRLGSSYPIGWTYLIATPTLYLQYTYLHLHLHIHIYKHNELLYNFTRNNTTGTRIWRSITPNGYGLPEPHGVTGETLWQAKKSHWWDPAVDDSAFPPSKKHRFY